MYQITIIGNAAKCLPIASKLLNRERTLSITIIQPNGLEGSVQQNDENIPRQISIIHEDGSIIYLKGNCVQLENNDYINYDYLIIESDSIDHINLSI